MLTRVHKILIGLLVVQVALVVVMSLRSDEPELVKDRPLLAGLDAAKVTRVRLFAGGADKPGVDLVRKGAGSWVVASHSDYPADAAKVKGLIEPLAKLAAGDPIATSSTRHKQLRVADRDFDRKLVLDVEGAGEKTIVIGGPVGSRRTAVRLGGDDVYAATEAPTFVAEPAGFVSTKYVDVPKAEIERVAIRRDQQLIELARVPAAPPPAPLAPAPAGGGSGSAAGSAAAPAPGLPGENPAGEGSGSAGAPAETWSAMIDGAEVKPAAGESLDTDAIDRFVGQAALIELKTPADPKRDASKPTATITIHRKKVEQPLVIDVIADGESYWIKQRDLDRAILVDKSRLADLVLIDRDKVVKKPPPPEPAPGAGDAPGSAATPPTAPVPGKPGAPAPAPARPGAPAPAPARPATPPAAAPARPATPPAAAPARPATPPPAAAPKP